MKKRYSLLLLMLLAGCGFSTSSTIFSDNQTTVAIKIQVNTENELIKNYAETSFFQDLQESISFSKENLNVDLGGLDLEIKIVNITMGSIPNGSTVGPDPMNGKFKIGISVPKDDASFTVENFKAIAFHEFGHLVVNRKIDSRTAVIRDRVQTTKAEMMRDPSVELTTAERDDILRKRKTMVKERLIVGPYDELLADVFANLFLNDSGQYGPRDFANIAEDMTDLVNINEHLMFNPIRTLLWKTHLSESLVDQSMKPKVWEIASECAISEIQSQIRTVKHEILQGIEPKQKPASELNASYEACILASKAIADFD